jgi:uncharacterized membrane protein
MTNIEYQPGAIDAGGAVGGAWEMLKGKYGMYLGISLIAIILTGCIPCLNIFLVGPIMGGISYVVLRDMRGEQVDFGMMFKGFEKFVPLMVIGLIQAVPGIIMQVIQYGVRFAQIGLGNRGGRSFDYYQAADRDAFLAGGMLVVVLVVACVLLIFSIIWWAIFFFAIPLEMEHGLGPVETIKLSARAGLSNIGGLILLFIFEFLVMLLGVLLICIGMFLISIPIMYLANIFAYRQVFPLLDRQFNMAPPPPTAYGFGGPQY